MTHRAWWLCITPKRHLSRQRIGVAERHQRKQYQGSSGELPKAFAQRPGTSLPGREGEREDHEHEYGHVGHDMDAVAVLLATREHEVHGHANYGQPDQHEKNRAKRITAKLCHTDFPKKTLNSATRIVVARTSEANGERGVNES